MTTGHETRKAGSPIPWSDRILIGLCSIVLTFVLVCASGLALGFLDWIVADEYYTDNAAPSEDYVLADPLYFAPSLLLMAGYALITWQILKGQAWCWWRLIAMLLVAWNGMLLCIGGASALFRMPGWFALTGKICYVIVVLYPAVWLFLPRSAPKRS